MARKSEAQAQQSRKWLAEALLETMQEKAFAGISVSEVAQRAQLDRRTFYRHFKTLEDILRFRLWQIAAEYEAVFSPGGQTTGEIAYAFFTVCARHRELLQLLGKHQLLPLVLYELNGLFPAFHTKYHGKADPYEAMGENACYAMAYHVGGFWNVLVRWIEDGCDKSPQELAVVVGSLLPEFI